jgi:hypothetical protein
MCPIGLCQLGAVRERLAVAGNARLVSRDHRGIAKDRCDQISIVANRDGLPILVSPELGECETTRHLQCVLVLRRNGNAAQRAKQHHSSDGRRDARTRQSILPGLIDRAGSQSAKLYLDL